MFGSFIIFLLSLLFSPFLVDGKLLDLMDLHEHVQQSQIRNQMDFKPMFQTLELMVKNPAFHKSLMAADDGLPLSSLPNVTTECMEDLGIILAMVMNQTNLYPGFDQVFAQIKDATASLQPPGILRGPFAFYGFIQECNLIHYSPPNRKREFQTDYSRAYLSFAGNCSELSIGFDLCIPKGCSSKDFMEIVNILPTIMPDLSSQLDICSITKFEDIRESLGTRGWIVLVFLIILSILGILAAIADYYFIPSTSPIRKSSGVQAFLAFSIYTNVNEILKAPKIKQGQIGPINCIRVISMFWVIFGHVCEVMVSFCNNFKDFLGIIDYPLTQLAENAFFSVDSFFFIGGVLLSFMWFKAYNKDKRTLTSPMSWIMFYIHRIIRLSAPFFVVLLIVAYIWKPISHEGPIFFRLYPTKENLCKKNLWKNMLYFFNLIDATEICMGQTWYLATDMQIFVLTPIILIPLALNSILGIAVAFILLFLSTAANIITVYLNRYPPTYDALGPYDPKMIHFDLYMKNVYYAMWIRCQVYIMGILVGWFLQKYKNIKIHPFLNLICWILSLSMMLTVVFGLFHYFQGNALSIFWRAAYSALSKPAWALGLTWIIISCYYGYGGPINSFMSWNIWVPLGKLSYCAYLVHGNIMIYIYGLENNAIYFSGIWTTIINYFVPTVVLTFFAALIVSALVEIPAGKLESLLLRPRHREIIVVDKHEAVVVSLEANGKNTEMMVEEKTTKVEKQETDPWDDINDNGPTHNGIIIENNTKTTTAKEERF